MGVKLDRQWREVVRSRAAAGLVLLVLAAHAFVASATHFHAPAAGAAGSSQTALARQGGGEREAPPSGDARCLMCRLQRNFVTGVPDSTPVLASPAALAPEHEFLRNTRACPAPTSLRSGRAPPLA